MESLFPVINKYLPESRFPMRFKAQPLASDDVVNLLRVMEEDAE